MWSGLASAGISFGISPPAVTAVVATGPSGTPDGVVDNLDYQFWVSHFGQTSGAGALSGSTVPEPGTLALLVVGICLVGFRAARLRG